MPFRSSYTLLLLLLLLPSSCSQDTNNSTSNEEEYFLNERTSSISADGDRGCWIGGEHGALWYKKENNIYKYEIGNERIYKVLRYHNSDSCFVGIRNGGLQLRLFKKGRSTLLREYPISYKGIHYSVYDIAYHKEKIYVGTSQGLFTVEQDSLKKIYPKSNNRIPFIVRCVCSTPTHLYASTPNGLLVPTSNKMLFEGENIDFCAPISEHLGILHSGKYTILSPHQEILKDTPLPFTARTFSHARQTTFFLSEQHLHLTNDFQHFTNIQLRRTPPTTSSHVLLADTTHSFTLLLTDFALWRIPFHLHPRKGSENITAACQHGQTLYLVSASGHLYSGPVGGTMQIVYDFGHSANIKWIDADDRYLYFTTDNYNICRIRLRGSLWKNLLFVSPQNYYHSTDKITAIKLMPKRLLLGVQDNVLSIENGIADTIKALRNRYVTSFYPMPGGDIYISTLNHGLYHLTALQAAHIKEFTQLPSIKTFFISHSYPHKIVASTGNEIISTPPTSPTPLRGIQRLLPISDTIFYAIPQSGIYKYAIRNNQFVPLHSNFSDIDFNPSATLTTPSSLLLGSELGMLQIKVADPSKETWITLEGQLPDTRLLGFIVILCFTILSLLIGMSLYRRSLRRKRRFLRINDLSNMFSRTTCYADVLPTEENEKINALSEDIRRLKHGDTTLSITDISNKAIALGNKQSLLLSSILSSQVDILRSSLYPHAPLYATQSETCLTSGNLQSIYKQVKLNRAFLETNKEIRKKLIYIYEELEKCPLPPVLSLRQQIGDIQQELLTTDIYALQKAYNNILQDFHALERAEGTKIRYDFITSCIHKLKSLNVNNPISQSLLLTFTNLSSSRENGLSVLQQLKRPYTDLQLLILLVHLRRAMDKYTEIAEELTAKNNRSVHRRYGFALDSFIAEHTNDISTEIVADVEKFINMLAAEEEETFYQILGFKNKDGRQCQVLALLMANPKVKRTYLSGMLGGYGNLNSVVSRLINGRLHPATEKLQYVVTQHPESIINYILFIEKKQ